MKYLNFDLCLKYFTILGPVMSWIICNLSLSVCDSRRLIDSVLLCHHSKDEQKVTKLKHSLQELGPVTVTSKDEESTAEGGGGFSEDLVIFCLSVEYVQSSEQFVRGKLRIDRDTCTCFVRLSFCYNSLQMIYSIYIYFMYTCCLTNFI